MKGRLLCLVVILVSLASGRMQTLGRRRKLMKRRERFVRTNDPWVVGEYREVVRRAKFRRYGFPPGWLEFLIEESLRLADPAPWAKRGPDPKDLPFLALAHVAGAWLVTGNRKHFPVAVRGGVTVISPAEYLARLGEE